VPALNVDGQPLHYAETGAGALALVLVHGAGGNHLVWTRQLEGLADAARVIALDLPGHGASGGDGCRTVADYAEAVRRFLVALGAPAVLGGHSLGGAIAQMVALSAPGLLRGIALVGTGARLRVVPKLFDLMREDHAAGVAFVNGQGWSPSSPPALVEGGRRAMLATRAAVTVGDFTACDGFDVMARLGEIAVPALVIAGEDDRLTPPRYAEHLAAAIPGARLVRVPAAGHYMMIEQPDAVNAALRDFLAALPGR
jgi:pimeloyl-ACP methyl ester carboxylesterase